MAKSLQGASSDKVIHVKGFMACPVQKPDGTWTVEKRPYEEDIPDLGRAELTCNQCGWSTYPACKEWYRAWCGRPKSNKKSQE